MCQHSQMEGLTSDEVWGTPVRSGLPSGEVRETSGEPLERPTTKKPQSEDSIFKKWSGNIVGNILGEVHQASARFWEVRLPPRDA